MKKLALLFCLIALSGGPAFATFSIVAIDRDTGEMGVAVASRYFSVGAVVPWAAADVGAVPTQASVNVGYAYVNVDDHPDPFGELRRLLDIQLGINHSSRLRRSLREGDLDAAMLSAERLIRYRPLRATAFMDQGFLLYLNGQADSAIDSFRRARGLAEDNFESCGNGWSRRPPTKAWAKTPSS